MEILASHPEVALGVERYKRLWLGRAIETLTPELFERDRFFDFSDGLTNLVPEQHPQWAAYYARMAAKWDTATYVGDKVTSLRMQPVLGADTPRRRFVVHRARHRRGGALVERARARSRRPVLVRRRPTRACAVRRWNAALRTIRVAQRDHPDRIVVVEYARFFGDPQATSLHAVLDFLRPWPTSRTSPPRSRRAREAYTSTIADKPRELPEADRAFIDAEANRRLWRRVKRIRCLGRGGPQRTWRTSNSQAGWAMASWAATRRSSRSPLRRVASRTAYTEEAVRASASAAEPVSCRCAVKRAAVTSPEPLAFIGRRGVCTIQAPSPVTASISMVSAGPVRPLDRGHQHDRRSHRARQVDRARASPRASPARCG